MKKLSIILGLFLAAAMIFTRFEHTPGNIQEQISEGRETAITRAIKKVSPAVVGVNVTQIERYSTGPFNDPFFEYFFGQPFTREVKSLGSGFFVSSDGYVLTNSHVVEGAEEIIITTPGGDRHTGEVIGLDKVTDIALLKIDVKNVQPVELGESDDVIIGEWVVALGNPFGLFDVSYHPTATAGIISGADMDFGAQQNDRRYQDMLQTDASINSGNSGGPLVNADGKVIGINTFIFTGGGYSRGSVGVGFAIPINRVKLIMEELKERGEIDWSFYTGVRVQEIDEDLARALNLSIQGGLIVKSIDRGSPAAQAGIKVGDVIIEAQGQQIRTEQDIYDAIRNNYLHAGDILGITIWRQEKKIQIELRLQAGR